eukprot:5632379-Amphidinium_carterae.1
MLVAAAIIRGFGVQELAVGLRRFPPPSAERQGGSAHGVQTSNSCSSYRKSSFALCSKWTLDLPLPTKSIKLWGLSVFLGVLTWQWFCSRWYQLWVLMFETCPHTPDSSPPTHPVPRYYLSISVTIRYYSYGSYYVRNDPNT